MCRVLPCFSDGAPFGLGTAMVLLALSWPKSMPERAGAASGLALALPPMPHPLAFAARIGRLVFPGHATCLLPRIR